jgi:hypothetical protein
MDDQPIADIIPLTTLAMFDTSMYIGQMKHEGRKIQYRSRVLFSDRPVRHEGTSLVALISEKI